MSKKAVLIPTGAFGSTYLKSARLKAFFAFFDSTLYRLRNKKIGMMISGELTQRIIIVDLGCSRGTFSPILSSNAKLIGADINLFALKHYKRDKGDRIDVVGVDIHNLPFKKGSVDMIVCVSVLEHLKDVEKAIKSIKYIVKKEGTLLFGYPIEYNFLKRILKFFLGLFWTKEAKMINIEEFYNNPDTHKTDYITIRRTIGKHFMVLHKQKIPPLVPLYEVVKVRHK